MGMRRLFWSCVCVLGWLVLAHCVEPPPPQEQPVEVRSEANNGIDAGTESTTERLVPEQTRERSTERVLERVPEPIQEKVQEHGPEFVVDVPQTALQEALDKAVKAEFDKQGLVGLAVGALHKGKWVFLKGYGQENREKGIAVDPQKTMFRWASISKTFAGVVALKLVEQGKLDLDKPIQTYYTSYKAPTTYMKACGGKSSLTYEGKDYTCTRDLAELPLKAAEQVITSRQLLGHLAGIAHYSNGKGTPLAPPVECNDPTINTGMEWAMKYLLDKPLVSIPGAKYNYTTFGFNLLGVVLEKAGGTSFAEMVSTYIAKPADMRTLQPDYEWKDIPRRAVGYKKSGTEIKSVGSDDVSWKLAGGGFISTAYDMGLYCKALMANTLLTSAQTTLAWTRQTNTAGKSINYGLGFSMGVRNGNQRVGHTGSQQKTRTNMRIYPKDEYCFIVLTNSEFTTNTTNFVYAMEDVLRKAP